jgi:hypothetical protein
VDDRGLGPDALQLVTHWLCCTHGACSRCDTALPAPLSSAAPCAPCPEPLPAAAAAVATGRLDSRRPAQLHFALFEAAVVLGS